jgi:hypothetical protein
MPSSSPNGPGRPGRANFREGVASWPASHRAPRAGKAPGGRHQGVRPDASEFSRRQPDLHRPGLDPTPPNRRPCTYWMIDGSPAAPPAGSPWPKDAAQTGSSERPPDASARSATRTPSNAPVAQRPQRRRQRHPRRGLGLPVLRRPGPGRGRPGRPVPVVVVSRVRGGNPPAWPAKMLAPSIAVPNGAPTPGGQGWKELAARSAPPP